MTQMIEPTRQISMFAAEGEEVGQQSKIMQYAMSAIAHIEQMRKSALGVCLNLYLCSEQFKASGARGWETFCEQNFASYGLQPSKIREAVRIGRSYTMIAAKRDGDMPDLNHVSWNAMAILSSVDTESGESLVLEMEKKFEETGRGPTRRELEERLQEIESEHEQLKNAAKEKDTALHRNLNALNAREEELSSLRDQFDQVSRALESERRKRTTPVESVVEKLPKGVQSEAEAVERLREQRTQISDDIAQKEHEAARLKGEIAQLAQQAAIKKQVASALDELERDFGSMAVKYSQALVEKMLGADRNNGNRLEVIANRMRAMADQLSPALV